MTFLQEDRTVVDFTGREIINRSVAVSRHIQRYTETGDRVLLAYPAGLDFVSGFLGCVHAGRIAVPATYPKVSGRAYRYESITADCDAKIALTVSEAGRVPNGDGDSSTRPQWFCTKSWTDEAAVPTAGDLRSSAIPVSSGGSALAKDQPLFLQYTSGSTSQPKGVMVTQANVMANLDAIGRGFQLERLDPVHRVVCSWLPAYHDMGLIGVVLASLVHDGHAVMLSPQSFLRRPLRWLKAVSDYQASITVSPCFGYRWAADRIKSEDVDSFDLSSLGLAACGAEPIHLDALERFSDHFAPAGFRHEAFYPCYGLAENTLMVTGAERSSVGNSYHSEIGPATLTIARSDLRRGEASAIDATHGSDQLTLVSSGLPATGTKVCIVDPQTHRRVANSEVGEIWVSSPSVALGYWDQPETSQRTFAAKMDDENDPSTEGQFLRTGDLGLIKDGQLYVTGRIKDLIIVGGQNHYPDDIELTATACHEELAGMQCAAVATCQDSTERLILIHEVRRQTDQATAAKIIQAIRLAVATTHDVAPTAVVLVRAASLPRTTSGKLQRFECRRRFELMESGGNGLDGGDGFDAVSIWQHAAVDRSIFPDLSSLVASGDATRLETKIRIALRRWMAEHLQIGVDEIGVDRPFAELGLDSIGSVELCVSIETWLGITLSPVAVWSHPTTNDMAKHLSEIALQQAGSQQLESSPSDAAQKSNAMTESQRIGESSPTSTGQGVGFALSSQSAISQADFERMLCEIEAMDASQVQRELSQ